MDNTFPITKTLVWNNHDRHLTLAFCELLQQKSLTDVSIVCADKTILAHKLLLSAASPFFRHIIEQNPCKHPIIILHDYSSWVIEMILGFVYCGEIYIPHEAIFAFVEAAKDLEITGLEFINEITSPQISPSQQQPRRKQPKPNRLLEQETTFAAPLVPLDFSLKASVTSTSNAMMNDDSHINGPSMKKQKKSYETVGQVVHETFTVKKIVEAVLTPEVPIKAGAIPKKKTKGAVKEYKQRDKGKSVDQDLLSLPYPTLERKYISSSCFV